MTNSIPGWTGTHRYPTDTSTDGVNVSPCTGENPFVEPGVNEDMFQTQTQLDIKELQERVKTLEQKLAKMAYVMTNHLRIREEWL